MLTPELAAAYQATSYQIDTADSVVSFRAGTRSTEVDVIVAGQNVCEWAFISPGNPYSQPLDPTENQKRYRLMQEFLEIFGYVYWHGRGVPDTDDWPPEPAFFVVGIAAQKAIALAQVFDQNAIIFCAADGVPEIVDCHGAAAYKGVA